MESNSGDDNSDNDNNDSDNKDDNMATRMMVMITK